MRNLELLLNRNCNLDCDYCGIVNNTTREGTDEVKRDKFLGVLDEPFNDCYILGGEPTLNPDYLWVLNQLRDRNIKTYVYSNSKIKSGVVVESSKLSVRYILSYQPDQMKLKDFVSSASILNKLGVLDTIKCMWDGDMDSERVFWVLTHLFPKVSVYLEPVFGVQDQLMSVDNFGEDVAQYSEILNITNEHLDKTMKDMFIDKDDVRLKRCVISDTSITYDYQNTETFRCLTDCMENRKVESDICDNTYCLCDLDKVVEFL
jgi:organic radical activating enzyme